MDLKFIRLGHELGLGVGDPRDIEIVGYDISAEDWDFVQEDTFASKGQKLIYHGALKPFENVLLRSPLVPWSYFASNFYHNVYWYPFVGRPRVKAALDTKWGRLFENYGDGKVVMPGMQPRTVAIAAGATAAAALGLLIAGGLIARGRVAKKVDPVRGVWRVDLHMHTWASPDSKTDPKALIERAREIGLNRIAVTDHNVIAGAVEAHRLAPDLVIVGEEIVTETGGELIAYFVRETVPPHLPVAETIRRLREQGAVISISHPLDSLRNSALGEKLTLEIIEQIDALEV